MTTTPTATPTATTPTSTARHPRRRIGAPDGIFVAVRDRDLIRAAMGGRSFRAVEADSGVPRATLNDLTRGHLKAISARYAAALEEVLGAQPGSLFGLTVRDAELLAAYAAQPVSVPAPTRLAG